MQQDAPERTPGPPEDPEAPVRRRRPTVLGAVVALGALAAVVGVAANVDLLGDAETIPPATSPAPPPPAPGGMHDQERPGQVGALDPASRSDSKAAIRNGWTMTAGDEFDGDALDRTKWSPYTGETTGRVGRHLAENISVRGGQLVLTSRGLTSAGLARGPAVRPLG